MHAACTQFVGKLEGQTPWVQGTFGPGKQSTWRNIYHCDLWFGRLLVICVWRNAILWETRITVTQALWGEHGAVTGKQAQPIWNVLTSKCIHGIAVSHTKTTCSTCYSAVQFGINSLTIASSWWWLIDKQTTLATNRWANKTCWWLMVE